MRIGLQIPKFTWPGGPAEIAPRLAEIGRTADDAGFASIWVMDHLFQIGRWLGPAESEMLEGYSALSYLAGVTKKARLGTMVTAAIYRYPGVLVKTVTTLDVLSGGRAYLGIGAGWNEREAVGLGIPFPSLKERFERLEENLQIAKQMWSDNNGPYNGKHYQLAETLNVPQSLSKPHPPILIGGSGEKKTLRFVAQYGDGCNLFSGGGIDVLKAKLAVLQQHCQDLGRDYGQIEKTTLDTAHLAADKMNASDIIKKCRELADAGIQQAIFNMPNVDEIKPLEIFGKEIIPVVAEF